MSERKTIKIKGETYYHRGTFGKARTDDMILDIAHKYMKIDEPIDIQIFYNKRQNKWEIYTPMGVR